jgi:hypothetical protein
VTDAIGWGGSKQRRTFTERLTFRGKTCSPSGKVPVCYPLIDVRT